MKYRVMANDTNPDGSRFPIVLRVSEGDPIPHFTADMELGTEFDSRREAIEALGLNILAYGPDGFQNHHLQAKTYGWEPISPLEA